MQGAGVDFYWLSANGIPPPDIADISWKESLPQAAPLPGTSVAFLAAGPGEQSRQLGSIRAKFGRSIYLVLVQSGDDAALARFLDEGADDVCTPAELMHPAAVIARARRWAELKGDAGPSTAAGFKHLRAGLDALPIPIFFKDAHAVYVDCNEAFRKMLGRSNDGIIGKTVYETAHPDMAESYAQSDRRLIEKDGVQVFDSVHRFSDGSLHDVCVVKAVFRNEAGKIDGFAGVMIDITHRKLAEAALQESEERYREVFENASDAVFLTDITPDGRFKFAGHNPAGERLMGFSNAQAVGKFIEEFLPPPIAAQASRNFNACLSAGTTIRCEEQLDLPGGARWLVFSLIPIRAKDGTIHRIIGIARDITDERLLEKMRRERELEFRTLIEDSPDIIVRYDRDCRRRYANAAYRANCRIPVEEALGKTPREFGPFTPPEAERYEQALMRVLRTGVSEEIEMNILGGAVHSIRIFPDRDTTGGVKGLLTISRDVTDRIKAERQLRQREQEFRTLVENTPDTIARYDRQCRRTYINPALARSLGSAAEALGRTPAEGSTLVDPDEYIAKIKEVFRDGLEREYEGATRRRNGKMKWAHIRFVPEFDEAGAVASVLAIGRDITEIVESRNKIQRMAFFDSLTGLPNRSLLNDSVQQLAVDARSGGRQFGLMMLDLDRFKEVNDTLGHAAGDALLCEVAARLRTCVRSSDMIARLGGDEFAILLPNMRRKADLFVPAAKILRSLAEPFHVAGREITVTTSIGITKFPFDGADIEILFKQADSAMYHAKRMGRNNFQFYTPEMTERTVQRLVIETTLRKACSRGELELYYQPQVALRSGEWLGAEALLRWNHPELGLLTPGKFVGIAEETGLIVDIGRWALNQACRAAADWNVRRALPLRVAVNLSSRQFVMNDLVSNVREALQTAGCRPEWLELEITESLLLEDSHTVRSMLDELSALGVSIAIDDFGIGYSALGYLTRFPIDTLKIDRSFINDIDTDHKRAELMKAIIAIAKALKLRLVAEGVENKGQVSFLLGNGCALAQGYLYGKPMPRGLFTELLQTDSPQSPVLTRRRKHASVA